MVRGEAQKACLSARERENLRSREAFIVAVAGSLLVLLVAVGDR
jgi:hypothetical protein